MPKQFQKESKHTRTFKNIESHHEFHHDNSGRFTTFLAVMDLYINMMMSTMPGSHGRPLWRKQLQSAWDHPDWLQLKQKGLVLKMSTDPPNSSKIRCEMEEVSAARIIFHILCSTICLSKKCGFAPSIEYVPGDLSKQNCLAQRRGNFLALEANPINWMDGLYSTHHLSNPLKIQGVLPPNSWPKWPWLQAVGVSPQGPGTKAICRPSDEVHRVRRPVISPKIRQYLQDPSRQSRVLSPEANQCFVGAALAANTNNQQDPRVGNPNCWSNALTVGLRGPLITKMHTHVGRYRTQNSSFWQLFLGNEFPMILCPKLPHWCSLLA